MGGGQAGQPGGDAGVAVVLQPVHPGLARARGGGEGGGGVWTAGVTLVRVLAGQVSEWGLR